MSLDQGGSAFKVPEGGSVSTQPSCCHQCGYKAGPTVLALQEEVGKQNGAKGMGTLTYEGSWILTYECSRRLIYEGSGILINGAH